MEYTKDVIFNVKYNKDRDCLKLQGQSLLKNKIFFITIIASFILIISDIILIYRFIELLYKL